MNQVFDFNRWLLLTGKHWSENRKRYLLSLIAVAGLLLLWFSFMSMIEAYSPLSEPMQVVTYYFGLYIVGCLYASMLFSDLSSAPKTINYLSVPASTFEKLLVALFYGLILYLITYTIIFYLINIPMVNLANSRAYSQWLISHEAGEVFKPEKVVNVFSMASEHGQNYARENNYFYIVLIYIVLQSAYILGSVYFPGYSAIKTTVALLVITLFFLFFVSGILKSFMPHEASYNSFTSYKLDATDQYYRMIKLPGWINAVLVFIIKYAIGPILWVVTYFRLKEKEV